MTQTTLFRLKAMGAEGETKKGPTAFRRGRPFDYAHDRPFIVPPSCSDQESQALTRLYQRAAFRVKQESGFLSADISVQKQLGRNEFAQKNHKRMAKKQIFANCLLVISSLALAGTVGELTLRALGYKTLYVNPEREIFWEYHPLLGWHHDPGQHGILESSEFKIAVCINQKGLRDRDYSYERTPGKRRILVLGDSFVWGFGVEQNQTFTEQLENLLTNVEVINAGVSGYSTDQELLWFKSEGVKYSPDLVILVVSGIDDSLNHLELVYVIYYKPRFTFGQNGQLELQNVPVPQASAFMRSLYWGCKYSSLVNFLMHNVRPAILQTLYGQGSFKTKKLETFNELDPSQQFTLTLALIDEIRRTSEAANAQLMIVTNSIFWLPHQPGATYEELVLALKDNYPYVLDIEESTGYSSEQMTIPHDGHWNQDGHRFVAEQILKFIEENRLLEP